MHCFRPVPGLYVINSLRLLIYFGIQICYSLIFSYSVLFEFLNRFISFAMEEDFPIYLSWITEMYKAYIFVSSCQVPEKRPLP